MTLNPYQHGAPCSCCGSYCGVDEYDYKGKVVCAACRKLMKEAGQIIAECSKCGTLIDDDMDYLLDKNEDLYCEGCYPQYNEDGDADR